MVPAPEYCSGSVADRLATSCRKIELFLQVQETGLVSRELRRMSQTTAYLKANFPPAALAKGPIRR